jgi:hypothetical protein
MNDPYRPLSHHAEGSFALRSGRVGKGCLGVPSSGSKSAGYGVWNHPLPILLPIPDILCHTPRMRNLIATICLTIAVLLGSAGMSASAEDLKMKPLDQILAEETSLANTSTYLLRCFSLYTVTSEWLLSNLRPEVKDKGQKLSDASTTIIQVWMELDKMQSQTGKEDLNFVKTQTKIMADEYTKMMSRSKALTGSVFGNPTVKSDLFSCKRYEEIVNDVLKTVLEELKNRDRR